MLWAMAMPSAPPRSTDAFVVVHPDADCCALFEDGSVGHAVLDALTRPHIRDLLPIGAKAARWTITIVCETNGDIGVDFDTHIRRRA